MGRKSDRPMFSFRKFVVSPKYFPQSFVLADKFLTKPEALARKKVLKSQGFLVRIEKGKGIANNRTVTKHYVYAKKW